MDNKLMPTPMSVLTALIRAAVYVLVFIGMQVVVRSAFSLIIGTAAQRGGTPLSPAELDSEVMQYALHITLIAGVLTLIVLAAAFLLRHQHPLAEMGLLPTKSAVVVAGAAITPALYGLVILVLGLLPAAWLTDYNQASASLSDTGILAFLSTVLLPPLVEEVVFRGLVLSRLRQVMSGWLAVVLSALVFGLCHGQPVWMGYAFVLGLFFGWLTLRARSILPAMAAHFVFNAIGHISVLLDGVVEQPVLLAGLFLISLIACLLTRKGLAHLLRRSPNPAQ